MLNIVIFNALCVYIEFYNYACYARIYKSILNAYRWMHYKLYRFSNIYYYHQLGLYVQSMIIFAIYVYILQIKKRKMLKQI